MGAKCGKDKLIYEPTPVADVNKRRATSSTPRGDRSARSRKNSEFSTGSDGDLPIVSRRSRRSNTGRSVFITHTQAGVANEYDVGEKAGEGTQGVVFRATRKRTGVMRAVKKVPKKAIALDKLHKEIDLMKRMDHPNIIKLFETFEDKTSMFLVMELCSGGELFDKIVTQGSLNEHEAAIVLQQILRAVHYMHENDICHRDLKPENFLFLTQGPIDEDNLVKLIDFGIACECGPNDTLKELCGTPFYIAPQVLTRKYDKMADLWSCGVIMFTLLSGNVPFHGPSDAQVLAKVREGIVRYNQKAWRTVSPDAVSLVKKLLTRNVKERYTARQALDHNWIKGHAPTATAGLEGELLQNLQAFRNKNRLKQAALALVANEIDDDKIRHLRQRFTALDTNRDGLLTYEEIRSSVEQDGLTIPSELEELWRDSDVPIDYTEFLAATLDKRAHLSDEVINVAFGMFDVDNSGRITTKDISRVFEGTTKAKMSRAEGIVQKYSTTGDGTMDFADFKQMMNYDASPASHTCTAAAAQQSKAVTFEVAIDDATLVSSGTFQEGSSTDFGCRSSTPGSTETPSASGALG